MQVQSAVDAGLPSTLHPPLSSPLRGTGQSQTFRETTTRLHILIIYPSELASTFFISIIHYASSSFIIIIVDQTSTGIKIIRFFLKGERKRSKSLILIIILARESTESTESKQVSKQASHQQALLPT